MRKNRWAKSEKAIGLVSLPLSIKAFLTNEQYEAFALHLRIEELSQKLRIGDVVPTMTPGAPRSPSPPPQYDNFGKRINTRDARHRKKLEDERHALVERAIKEIPDYRPPVDYRRPNRTQEKIYVPVNDYPEINFIGLLIGPRGNTLKNMERESGAKIAIRGRGSVKEGKGRNESAHGSNLEEDLHCLVMADTEDKLEKAIGLINRIIETAASTPEAQNDLKKNQLRELAIINGTLRDDENQPCPNCGEIGHRKYDCPQARNFTTNITCRNCGGVGHMARDCRQPRNVMQPANGNTANADQEYERLMSELGGSREPAAAIDKTPWAAGEMAPSAPRGPGLKHDRSHNPVNGNQAWAPQGMNGGAAPGMSRMPPPPGSGPPGVPSGMRPPGMAPPPGMPAPGYDYGAPQPPPPSRPYQAHAGAPGT